MVQACSYRAGLLSGDIARTLFVLITDNRIKFWRSEFVFYLCKA